MNIIICKEMKWAGNKFDYVDIDAELLSTFCIILKMCEILTVSYQILRAIIWNVEEWKINTESTVFKHAFQQESKNYKIEID